MCTVMCLLCLIIMHQNSACVLKNRHTHMTDDRYEIYAHRFFDAPIISMELRKIM